MSCQNNCHYLFSFTGQLEPFKVALIVVASVIAAGLLVTVIIALIKRKGR